MNNPEILQLRETIKKLEERLNKLESVIEVIGGKINIKAGNTLISLSPISVLIKSNDIELSASGKATVKASGNVILKGSQILQN